MALSHGIFGNFIFLCWLWAFKLQIEEKDLFGCKILISTQQLMIPEHPTFVQLETN